VWRQTVAWVALALCMAVSAALIWTWSSHDTLIGDEWGYALRTATQPASTYLLHPPPGKHLIAVPLLAYKAAFDTFGIDSYTPYRLGHIFLLLLCAFLFYVLARRRVGDSLAVLPAAILLFLGTSWEVVATPLRSPSLMAVAAGLGMLIALDRRALRRDVAACVLLGVSLASHSTAFAFAAAAIVLVLSRPAPERWRRSWLFILPIASYAIWWFVAFDPGESKSFASTVVGLPVYFAESLGASVLATAGLFTYAKYGGIDIGGYLATVIELALIALLASVVVARLGRPRPISPFAWSMVAALLVFWAATAFAPGPSRAPGTSRYLYPDALLLLLLLCEFGRDFELPRTLTPRVAVALVTLVAISLAGNVYELRTQEGAIDGASDRVRASLAAVALEDGPAPPAFSLADTLAGRFPASDLTPKLALPTLAAVFAKYGSPAYSPAQLAARPQSVRLTADYVSLQLAGTEVQPTPAPQSARPGASRQCRMLRPVANAPARLVPVPDGRLELAAGPGPPVALTAGEFADGAAVPIGSLHGGQSALLNLPGRSDATPQWRVGIKAGQSVLACT
jgi:hypothetical protein